MDALRIFQAAILVLGLVVAYYASKGYKKTGSRSLLFLALGFVFVAIGSATAGLFYEFLHYDLASAEAVEAGTQVIGFLLIVYSILGTRN